MNKNTNIAENARLFTEFLTDIDKLSADNFSIDDYINEYNHLFMIKYNTDKKAKQQKKQFNVFTTNFTTNFTKLINDNFNKIYFRLKKLMKLYEYTKNQKPIDELIKQDELDFVNEYSKHNLQYRCLTIHIILKYCYHSNKQFKTNEYIKYYYDSLIYNLNYNLYNKQNILELSKSKIKKQELSKEYYENYMNMDYINFYKTEIQDVTTTIEYVTKFKKAKSHFTSSTSNLDNINNTNGKKIMNNTKKLNINNYIDTTLKTRIEQNILNYLKKKYTHSTIILPKLINIDDSKLGKVYGLCNFELYNLLNNNKLNNVCFNNIYKFNLDNQFILYSRKSNTIDMYDNLKYDILIVDNYLNYYLNLSKLVNDNDNFFNNLNNIINKIYCINDNSNISNQNVNEYYRNAIIDFKFNIDDKLINNINKCKHRYFHILGSQLSFNDNIGFINKKKTNFKGGHRVSLILDLKDKNIYFYDPYSIYKYNTCDLNGNLITSFLNLLIKNYFINSNDYFKDYKAVYVFNNIQLQNIEYAFNNNTVNNVELYNIINYKKKQLKAYTDWAIGYCGLWNVLLIFLLSINPDKDIEDIYYFYNRICMSEYKYSITKTLIRSFAYHIESIINRTSKVIPIEVYKFLDIVTVKDNTTPYRTNISNEADFVKFDEASKSEINRLKNAEIRTTLSKANIILKSIVHSLVTKYPIEADELTDIKALKNQITFINF
jgi:hypothetical protein